MSSSDVTSFNSTTPLTVPQRPSQPLNQLDQQNSECKTDHDIVNAINIIKNNNISPIITSSNAQAGLMKRAHIYAEAANNNEKAQCAIIEAKGRLGYINLATLLFSRMRERHQPLSCASYNVMLGLLAKYGKINEVFHMYDLMVQSVKPDSQTLEILVKAHASIGQFDHALQKIDKFYHAGSEITSSAYSPLLQTLAQIGDLDQLLDVLDHMKSHGYAPQTSDYILVIEEAEKHCFPKISNHFFNLLQEDKSNKNIKDYESLAAYYCSRNKMDQAEQIIQELAGYGIKPTQSICNSLIFNPTLEIYHSLIYFSAKSGQKDKVDKYISEMLISKLNPNMDTHRHVMEGYIAAGNLDGAHETLQGLRIKGIQPSIGLYRIMVMAYLKRKQAEKAELLLEEMNVIGLCADLEMYHQMMALPDVGLPLRKELLNKMLQDGIVPSLMTFNHLLGSIPASEKGKMIQWIDMTMKIHKLMDAGFTCHAWNSFLKKDSNEKVIVQIKMPVSADNVRKCRDSGDINNLIAMLEDLHKSRMLASDQFYISTLEGFGEMGRLDLAIATFNGLPNPSIELRMALATAHARQGEVKLTVGILDKISEDQHYYRIQKRLIMATATLESGDLKKADAMIEDLTSQINKATDLDHSEMNACRRRLYFLRLERCKLGTPNLESAKTMTEEIQKVNLNFHKSEYIHAFNQFLVIHAKLGRHPELRGVIERQKQGESFGLNVGSYNALLEGLCNGNQVKKAETVLLEEMTKHKVPPTIASYNILFAHYTNSSTGAFDSFKMLLEKLRESGMAPNAATYCAWIKLLGSTKNENEAIFEQMLATLREIGYPVSATEVNQILYSFLKMNRYISFDSANKIIDKQHTI